MTSHGILEFFFVVYSVEIAALQHGDSIIEIALLDVTFHSTELRIIGPAELEISKIWSKVS